MTRRDKGTHEAGSSEKLEDVGGGASVREG